MFGNNKEKPETNENSYQPVSKPVSSKDTKTLIGEGVRVEGNFFIPTPTRVDGVIKGNLTGDSTLVIGEKGWVEGTVTASEVLLLGTIEGNVEAKRLDMKKGSRMIGDILVDDLITEIGCTFNGRCSMKPEEQSNVQEMKPQFAPPEEEPTGNVRIKSKMSMQ
jgi:cytoskeletal protein CcmA (bactofilin family)